VNPDTFVDRMRALIEDPEDRADRAARGRAYVAREHDAPVVAGRLLRAYATPVEPVPLRSFPDWTSLQHVRRLERAEYRVFQLEQALARERQRSGRPGAEPKPRPVRAASRRGRAWASRRLAAAARRRLSPAAIDRLQSARRRLRSWRDAALRARRGAS
jgi:hypothetical protein